MVTEKEVMSFPQEAKQHNSGQATAVPSPGTGIAREYIRVGRLSFQQENSNEGFCCWPCFKTTCGH